MQTSDIWFAAHLRMKGYKITDFEVIGKGRGRYTFDINPDNWKSEKLEFNNSIASELKIHQIALKDLLH